MPNDSNSRPNIVFFMMDQLSAKWLEGDMAAACPTPNIDWLRDNGVTFSSCLSSNPVCCPSRATMATGLTTRGHGVLQNGYELDPALPTFMQSLQGAGWQTAAYGKIHFHSHFHGVHPDYRPYGFDTVLNTEDPRAGEWLDWLDDYAPEYYDAALATIWPTGIPELQQYGPEQVDLLDRIARAKERYASMTDRSRPDFVPGCYEAPFPAEITQTEWITRNALDYIADADPERPLYTHISYVQPHGPSCPPEGYLGQIDTDLITEPLAPEWVDDLLGPACYATSEGVLFDIPSYWRGRRQFFLADMVHLDEQLGQVITGLRDAGRWDNTYLILITDHGELLMDHGFTGKGERPYDACVRVPLMIAGPGLQGGTTRSEIVQLEDICPTVLEMADLPLYQPTAMGPYLKETPVPALAGRSLLPLCRGEQARGWRDAGYIESYNNIGTCTPRNWARTVRTARYRYTMFPGNQGEQLFDLRNDPDETVNLAGDAAYGGVRREMRDRLLEEVLLQDYPHSPRELFSLGVH